MAAGKYEGAIAWSTEDCLESASEDEILRCTRIDLRGGGIGSSRTSRGHESNRSALRNARSRSWLIARQGGVPVVAGLAAGVCLTLALSGVMVNLLYGIQTANPAVLAIVSLAFLGAAAPAILLPARWAARVDPMIALRDESIDGVNLK